MLFCFLLEARPLSTQNGDKDRYVAIRYIAVFNQCLKNTQNIRYVWGPRVTNRILKDRVPQNMHSSPLCSNFNPVTHYMRYQLNYLLILYVVPSMEQNIIASTVDYTRILTSFANGLKIFSIVLNEVLLHLVIKC